MVRKFTAGDPDCSWYSVEHKRQKNDFSAGNRLNWAHLNFKWTIICTHCVAAVQEDSVRAAVALDHYIVRVRSIQIGYSLQRLNSSA